MKLTPINTFLCLITGSLLCTSCSVFKNTTAISKPEMVFVEGGAFLMGDLIDSTNTDALPLHEVRLGDFYIGKYEVTFGEYDEFARQTGRPLPEDDHYGRGERAVVRVNWDDALAYCKYFGFRLPAETEWEYAARSGGKKQLYPGTNNPDSLLQYAITDQANISFAFRTGSKKPNELGLHDMSGNVAEWIGRYYQYYENPGQLHDLEKSAVRIIRGGSFNSHYNQAKVYWRVAVLSSAEYYNLGFRCAISQEELNKQRFLKGFFHRKPKRP